MKIAEMMEAAIHPDTLSVIDRLTQQPDKVLNQMFSYVIFAEDSQNAQRILSVLTMYQQAGRSILTYFKDHSDPAYNALFHRFDALSKERSTQGDWDGDVRMIPDWAQEMGLTLPASLDAEFEIATQMFEFFCDCSAFAVVIRHGVMPRLISILSPGSQLPNDAVGEDMAFFSPDGIDLIDIVMQWSISPEKQQIFFDKVADLMETKPQAYKTLNTISRNFMDVFLSRIDAFEGEGLNAYFLQTSPHSIESLESLCQGEASVMDTAGIATPQDLIKKVQSLLSTLSAEDNESMIVMIDPRTGEEKSMSFSELMKMIGGDDGDSDTDSPS